MANGTDGNRKISATRFAVIDTELTGLDGKRDAIISVGAVRMTGGRIEISESFYRLVNPEKELKAPGVVIHEITSEDLLQKPGIDEVMAEFQGFFGADVIVGYCVEIDMEFLNREMKRIFGASIQNPVIDIYPLYEWARSRSFYEERTTSMPGRAKLYDIARYYDIAVNGAHNSLVDAFITAQIFQRLIPGLTAAGITDVGELIRLSNRLKGGDRQGISSGISNF
ncbi:MAG: 3'-5' exonuclease [Nitrospiraceae bacterium]|nr:3'-5' exonuclease [Nitrospiraceae bacterium]